MGYLTVVEKWVVLMVVRKDVLKVRQTDTTMVVTTVY